MTKVDTSRECQVANNLLRDKCIPDWLSEAFCRLIEDQPSPVNPKVAHKIAIDFVNAQADKFMCTGREYGQGEFLELLHLEKVGTIRDCIPDAHRAQFNRLLPLQDDQLKGKLDDTEKELLEQAVNRYKRKRQTVFFGRNSKIVWAADCGAINEKEKIAILIDRIGLVGWDREDLCLLFTYDRKEIPLHMPNSLDGIGNSQFEPPSDCDKGHGKTKPLTFENDGVPEAIHREREIQFTQFSVERL